MVVMIADKRLYIKDVSMGERLTAVFMAALLAASFSVALTGCGDSSTPAATTATTETVTAPVTTPATPAGIVLDPALKSATGIPGDAEMAALIQLQGKVAYPVIVPTWLPGGLALETSRIGSGKAASDPVGYYSYRFSQAGNSSQTLTFNQSQSNNRELKGYYLTEEEINGTLYQVYWHKTRDYLPEDQAVRTGYIEEPETFVVIWKRQYTDSSGASYELFYSLSTGTWSGLDWWTLRQILESLRPLSEVGQA